MSPNTALADAPVSPFQKVDKTGIIGGIASVIENGIDAAHTGLEGDGMTANTYGIAIILFTLLVRTITLPLTKMQLESSTQMQQIQPLQKKIQAAFPSKNQEQAKKPAYGTTLPGGQYQSVGWLLSSFGTDPCLHLIVPCVDEPRRGRQATRRIFVASQLGGPHLRRTNGQLVLIHLQRKPSAWLA
jgi:hypothetical protein